MGKLNIAHHKSYHPYRRDNIEKVRRDEEEARAKEAKEEGRMMLADSEARMDLLRERAGSSQRKSKKKRPDDDMKAIEEGGTSQGAILPTTNGHINLFQDLEHNAVAAVMKMSKKPAADESEKGFPLAPSVKDLNPWYSERASRREDDEVVEDDRRKRDLMRKSVHDPLTSITRQLSSHPSTSSSTTNNRTRPPPPALPSSSAPSEVQARLAREATERERALALIRRRKREMMGSETPSTVHGEPAGGYADVYNRREVEEAHRGRERHWGGGGGGSQRRWGDDRDRRRDADIRDKRW